jgi:hypothetical protein
VSTVETFAVAVKHVGGVFYGSAKAPLWVGFEDEGKLGKQPFLQQWKGLDDSNERRHTLSGVGSVSQLASRLAEHNVFEVCIAIEQSIDRSPLFSDCRWSTNIGCASSGSRQQSAVVRVGRRRWRADSARVYRWRLIAPSISLTFCTTTKFFNIFFLSIGCDQNRSYGIGANGCPIVGVDRSIKKININNNNVFTIVFP